MARNVAQHIYFPIPSLKDLPQPVNREERLKIIIANLDKQHQIIRNNIIAAAKKTRQQNLQYDNNEDAMDMHTSPSTQEPMEYNSNYDQNQDSAGIACLIANLNAPYDESMGDPCMPSDGSLPRPPPGIQQVAPPPQIQLMKETLDALEVYDRQAKQSRDYYIKALERTRRNSSSASVNTASPADAARDPRKRPHPR